MSPFSLQETARSPSITYFGLPPANFNNSLDNKYLDDKFVLCGVTACDPELTKSQLNNQKKPEEEETVHAQCISLYRIQKVVYMYITLYMYTCKY